MQRMPETHMVPATLLRAGPLASVLTLAVVATLVLATLTSALVLLRF